MPSIRQELATTRSARWYQAARGAQQRAAWAERVRCYEALAAVLADQTAGAAGAGGAARAARAVEGDVTAAPARDPAAGTARGGGPRQPPVELSGLVTLVARRAHFAGPEPVYRRFRPQHESRPVARWAGPDPAIKPAAALVAEAKITAFWPYREDVIKVADSLDMTPGEWAAAYLHAVAAWAAGARPLAAYRPVGPPECVREDMLVLAAASAANPDTAARDTARDTSRETQQAQPRAARLHELAGDLVRAVLDDPRLSPGDAFGLVRDEVRQLLAMPTASLAERLARTLAELHDRISNGADGDPLSADQAARLLSMTSGLAALLAGTDPAAADPPRD